MIKFYLIVCIELLFSPLLYLWEELKKLIGKYRSDETNYRLNTREINNEVIFIVHEWAGYPFVRQKTIKYVNHKFYCGLKFHFDRLVAYKGKYKLRKILTISDCTGQYLLNLEKAEFYNNGYEIYQVDNKVMDFSGYAYACENLLDAQKEQVVFLTNTSVDSAIIASFDDFIELLKNNPEFGLLGISYSTKIYQTFIRNNFRPHLQSFFLVSRSSVLQELIAANKGHFPGSTEDYKLSIIRFGEVKITEMIQKLGYKVGVIAEDGKLHTLPDHGMFHNGFSKWKLPMNDYRLHAIYPNRINILIK